MLTISQVTKAFGGRTLFEEASLQVNRGDRIGLVGPNGAGKSTLFSLILGDALPDEGKVALEKSATIGFLPQEHAPANDETVLELACGKAHDPAAIETDWQVEPKAKRILAGLAFRESDFERSTRTLSGGWVMRAHLARLLVQEPELLLLDEPTNHLDIRSIEWLEHFLKETDKTLVVVSHDRFFLDRVAARIIEVVNGRIQDYRGNYSDYLKERAARLARQEKEWQFQREWIEQQEDYIRRNIAGQKTKQAQSRRKLLARVKPIEKPASASAKVHFRFRPAERSSRFVLTTRSLVVGYEEKPLVRGIQFEVQRGERWAILGPNGSGKTTLLRTLMGARSPLSGDLEWNEALDVGYYDQQLQDLRPESDVLDEIRDLDSTATDGELRSYLAQFLFSGEDVYKKVGSLSGGEKSRLTLARIIYAAPQLLALDEPTNHLDIASREALESALMEYPGTILFVTHDRYLVQKIATHLIYIEDGRAHVFDRLSAFEEWLDGDKEVAEGAPAAAPIGVAAGEKTGLSKNKRDQIEREVAGLERKIASVEAEIAELELSFQNPATGTDWETTHKRYADLKLALDGLYEDLASRWELMQ
jgi:ATP-binding cassette subfamily F protein 3